AHNPTAMSPATPATGTQSSERRTLPRAIPSRWRCSPALCDPAYSSISPWCPSIRVGARCLLHMHVEERREDLRRRGCGGSAAVPAVLDHRTHHDLRVLGRAVAAPPRLALEPGVAGHRDELLGGARLAGDRDRELPEIGRAHV